MNILQLLIDFFRNPLAIPISIIVGLTCIWLLAQLIPGFVKFGFDIKLEKARREFLRKDKTAAISDLIILVQKSGSSEDDMLKANKILLNLCLHLPPCLVHKLAHTLKATKEKDDLGGPLGIFVQIKKYLDGDYVPDRSRVLDKSNIPLYTLKK